MVFVVVAVVVVFVVVALVAQLTVVSMLRQVVSNEHDMLRKQMQCVILTIGFCNGIA
jgi:hypothetical protein